MEKIEIRDHRQPGWFWLNKEVITKHIKEIGGNGLLVYSFLAMHANNETQKAWASLDHMAESLDLSKTTVVKHLRELEKAGLIQVNRQNGRVNIYTLLKIPEGRGSKSEQVQGEGVQNLNRGCSDSEQTSTESEQTSTESEHELDSLTRLINKTKKNKTKKQKECRKKEKETALKTGASSLKKTETSSSQQAAPQQEEAVLHERASPQQQASSQEHPQQSLKERLLEGRPNSLDLAKATGLTAKEKHDVPWELAELFALRWGAWTWPPLSKATAAVWREFGKQLLTRCGGDVDGAELAIRTFFDSNNYEWEKKHFQKPTSFLNILVIIFNRSVGEFSQFGRRKFGESEEPKEVVIWNSVLRFLRRTSSKDTLTYFASTRLIKEGEDEWVIEVPSQKIKTALENEKFWYLKNAVKNITAPEDDLPEFTFKVKT